MPGAAGALMAGGGSMPSVSTSASSGASGEATAGMYGNFGTGSFNVGGSALLNSPWLIGGIVVVAVAFFIFNRKR